MEQEKPSTKVAGIDVAKSKLDVALYGSEAVVQFANDPDGFAALGRWLSEHCVERIGLEATGGYERAVVAWLRSRGLQAVIHQPLEVRLFARLKRLRAKNDRIDAILIAAVTAQADEVKAPADPRLDALAERLTAYEQASDRLATMRASLEQVTLDDLKACERAQIHQLQAYKMERLRDVITHIKAHPDLKARYGLLMSLPGISVVVAAVLVIRMPELGSLGHGQAASLIGVAPFDRDTGLYSGQRHIAGGRSRPRRFLYLAAIAASRHDPGFRAFAQRLRALGKKPKVAIVAVMRKLIEAANLVLARGTPWIRTQPS
jgi:transposase